MTGELTIFKTGAAPSTRFQGANLPKQRLDDGVAAGFPRVSYKGSKWGIRYQGAYTPVQVRMQDGMLIQSPYLDVVILKASGHPNKAWYAGAYVEGDTVAPPDCWSSDGAKPDRGAPNPQSNTCTGCKHNVWGSKLNRDTGQNTRGKACMDSKRLCVVPVGDIENKLYGGPMMLSVPPSSLKRLGPYQNMLQANGFHYASVWTRITFESESAYPLFAFDAIAPLDDAQADQVLVMINHPQIDRILDAEQSTVEAWDESAASVHAGIGAGPQTAAEAMAQTGTVVQFPDRTAPVGTVVTPAVVEQPVAVQAKTSEQIEAEIAERVKAAVAEAAAKAAAAKADPGPIPEHLKRTPKPKAEAPEPKAEEAEAPEPQAEAPEAPTLPPGVTLPAGMTPEMAAAFMAQFTAQQAPKARRKRTPPVSPTAGDSAAATGLSGAAKPVAAGPAGPAAPMVASGPAAGTSVSGAPAGGQDAAIATIMGGIGKLL